MTNLSQRLARYRELNEKRTQGEWTSKDFEHEQLGKLVTVESSTGFYVVNTCPFTPEQDNAAFIAATPAMLTDLQALHGLLVEAMDVLGAENYISDKAEAALMRINAVLEKE